MPLASLADTETKIMDAAPQPPPLPPEQPPQRHGCLTAWLVFMIVINAIMAVLTPISIAGWKQMGLNPSPVYIGVIVLCLISNVVFAIALLRWQKWGFYGFIAASIVALAENLSLGFGVAQSLFGLIGIAILYCLLNMGGDLKAWPRLK